ncbi:MAG: acyl-CoA synthetase (AMP-forming)/AMP-acid ligase II [Myxococcota bacterium]|jgi:acyl-CoA synthetase (AMP-forming)/AMP-acid ligase II
MPRHNVADYLREHVRDRPETAALMFPAPGYRTSAPTWDTWTFRELDDASDAYARGFTAQGIRRGDRTVLLLKPSLEFYGVVFALFKLGAVPVLVDPGMGLKAVLSCIERTQPRAMIAMSLVHAVGTFMRRPFAACEVRITAGSRWWWGGATLAGCRVDGDPVEVARLGPKDDHAIVFTSGSTGPAKGVALKCGMFLAEVEALREMLGFEPGMKDVQAFAAFAIFDICLGMTSIIPSMDLSKPATAKPEDIVAAILANEPEAAFGSPIVWQNTTRYCIANDIRLPSLVTTMTVGAPIPAYLHHRFRKILAEGREVFTPYGATEGLPVSWIGTDEILADTWAKTAKGAGTCVGRIAPFVDVRIVSITDAPIPTWGDAVELTAGEVGEIVVCGPQISEEYKDAPEANRAAKIADGERQWHRMGDLGYRDEQGRLWFCGRKKHRLQTANGMVPAVPVEGVFNEHADVFRTALVGVGRSGSEVPVLCVELEPGAAWSQELEGALVALGVDTPYAGLVKRFLHNPAFPTDARHNSKIRREDLKPWAESKCADLIRSAT